MATQADRIIECFELYYSYGVERNLVQLEKHTGIELSQLNEWREGFAWDEKIAAREAELNRVLNARYAQKTDEIRNNLITSISQLLNQMSSGTLGLPFNISTPADLRSVSQAYHTLVQANVLARKGAVDVSGGDKPQTWSDLLGQVDEADTESQLSLEQLKQLDL